MTTKNTKDTKTTGMDWRSAGLLLHPTSLPGGYGIGDFGAEARGFVEALAGAKQKWWQMLPLTSPGEGNNPYQSYSAFAGNRLLISPDDLVSEGLLEKGDVASGRFDDGAVDFARVRTFKHRVLERAWRNFQEGAMARLREAFELFCEEQKGWLGDYALFVAIRESQGGELWQRWPRGLMRRRAGALAVARRELADAVGRESFIQFLFWRQMRAIKAYANARGVRLIGDLPIFVSAESADVWTRPELFKLDRQYWPRVVAGVPPDLFCATGQMWGNPLYHWGAMKREGYGWWMARIQNVLEQCDVVRIDHFRGFAAAWEIPRKAPDAMSGKWVKGPGADFFGAVRKRFGKLPWIAEDLGVITPDVEALRDRLGLPGMRVLQFAFGGGSRNPHLPQNVTRNNIAYTGTHDNDTTASWYGGLAAGVKGEVRAFVGGMDEEPARALMRVAWQSAAEVAIAPVQDLLELGGDARMNVPGVAMGNWGWRLRPGQLNEKSLRWLGTLTEISGRARQGSST
jgi:4-alpha-glucanotransferase